ncbi:MAG TPA: porin family protein [Bacteroidia bacterium]|nr:porin family protein [Bacteroidia bacterium]
MKHVTFFLMALTAVSVYAQDKPKETTGTNFRKVQIGFNFSPDLCYRTLKNNDGSQVSDIIVDSRDDMETSKFGYTSGFNVCFNIKKSFGLETGIQYSNKGYQTRMSDLRFALPNPGMPQQAKTKYNFHCIDIPVKANLIIGKKKVRFFTSAGVTTNISIKETQIMVLVYSDHTSRETNQTTDSFKRINISPSISAGIDYKINDRSNLRVEPTFRYGILKIIDESVAAYLYSYGLNIGYYYGL